MDEFLLNPQVRAQSGTVPGTSPYSNTENQEPSTDRSQDDPRPEVGTSIYQSSQSTDTDLEASYSCINGDNQRFLEWFFFSKIYLYPTIEHIFLWKKEQGSNFQDVITDDKNFDVL